MNTNCNYRLILEGYGEHGGSGVSIETATTAFLAQLRRYGHAIGIATLANLDTPPADPISDVPEPPTE